MNSSCSASAMRSRHQDSQWWTASTACRVFSWDCVEGLSSLGTLLSTWQRHCIARHWEVPGIELLVWVDSNASAVVMLYLHLPSGYSSVHRHLSTVRTSCPSTQLHLHEQEHVICYPQWQRWCQLNPEQLHCLHVDFSLTLNSLLFVNVNLQQHLARTLDSSIYRRLRIELLQASTVIVWLRFRLCKVVNFFSNLAIFHWLDSLLLKLSMYSRRWTLSSTQLWL